MKKVMLKQIFAFSMALMMVVTNVPAVYANTDVKVSEESIPATKAKKASYVIQFKGNGSTSGKMSKLSATVGKNVKLTANKFEKKGYKFTGWNTKANGKGKSYKNKESVKNLSKKNGATVTLYAQWKKVKYSITYELGKGKNSEKNPASYYTTSKTITLQNPTRKGYVFDGWYSDAKYKTKVTKIKSGSTGAKTFYAKWKKEKYTVTYKLDGGTNDKNNPKSYYITTDNQKLKAPTKKGYTFKGWYSDSKHKTKVTQIKKGSTGNKTFYAKWTVNKYKIVFDGNGAKSGTMSAMTNRNYGTSYKLTANVYKKTGYKFTGWNTKEDGSGKSYDDKASVKNLSSKDGATVTLYAQWKKIKYTVTYELAGGENNSKNPSYYYVNTETQKLQDPTRKGYTFQGWYSDAEHKTKVTEIAKGSTGDKTFYAKWTANTYTIKFDGNGATGGYMPSMTNRVYGTEYKLTTNLYSKTDYMFVEWNTKADGTGKSYENQAAVKNLSSKNGATVTLYAQWKKNDKSIFTFSTTADGKAVVVTGLAEGATETKLVIPSKYNGLPVEGISMGAFYGNTKITSVVIPDSVTEIASTAFSQCTNLEKVTLSGKLKSVLGFNNCTKLTSVTYKDVKYTSKTKLHEALKKNNVTYETSVFGITVEKAFEKTGLKE